MTSRVAIKRALEAAGFVFLRGGWVKREAAPRLQAQVDRAVKDAADDVAAVRDKAHGSALG